MTKNQTKTEAASILLAEGKLSDEQIMKAISCSKTTIDNARKANKHGDNVVYAIAGTIAAVYIYLVYLI